MTFYLREHQVKAIQDLDNGKVLIGDVGTGKSIASLAYFAQKHPDKRIIVITTAKKRDTGEWWADAMKMSLRQDLEVDSWNNIQKYVEVDDACFIFDEQKLVGKGAWVDAFYEIADKNPFIVLSATPADVWMDLVPLFIANGFYRNRTDFNNQHVVWSRFSKYPKVDRYLDPHILERHRDSLYVEMPLMRHTTREEHFINVEYDKEEERRLYRDRWNIYDNVPLKDAGEMLRLMRKSCNMHWSRLAAIKSLAKDNPRMIIFYNHNHELEMLRTLHCELDIPVAEWNGHNHQDVPQTDRWLYLVQIQAGAEGWNCITTDTVVFYSLPYSYRMFHQAKGRIDRLDTKYEVMHYYILKSRSIIDNMIWKSLGRKKDFNVRSFVKKIWPKEPAPRTYLN